MACRSAGFNVSGAHAYSVPQAGWGSGPIYLADVQCDASRARALHWCFYAFSADGTHSGCSRDNDVYLNCRNTFFSERRLEYVTLGVTGAVPDEVLAGIAVVPAAADRETVALAVEKLVNVSAGHVTLHGFAIGSFSYLQLSFTATNVSVTGAGSGGSGAVTPPPTVSPSASTSAETRQNTTELARRLLSSPSWVVANTSGILELWTGSIPLVLEDASELPSETWNFTIVPLLTGPTVGLLSVGIPTSTGSTLWGTVCRTSSETAAADGGEIAALLVCRRIPGFAQTKKAFFLPYIAYDLSSTTIKTPNSSSSAALLAQHSIILLANVSSGAIGLNGTSNGQLTGNLSLPLAKSNNCTHAFDVGVQCGDLPTDVADDQGLRTFTVAPECRDPNGLIGGFVARLLKVLPRTAGRLLASGASFSFSEMNSSSVTRYELELHFSLLNDYARQAFCLKAHVSARAGSATRTRERPPRVIGSRTSTVSLSLVPRPRNSTYYVISSSLLANWTNFRREVMLLLELKDDASFHLKQNTSSQDGGRVMFVIFFDVPSQAVMLEILVGNGTVPGVSLSAAPPSTSGTEGGGGSGGGLGAGAGVGIALGVLAVIAFVVKMVVGQTNGAASNKNKDDNFGRDAGLLRRWDDDFIMNEDHVLPIAEEELVMIEEFAFLQLK